MDDHDQDYDLPSPRTNLFGAHRASTNPRLHALAKPYSRPASFHDALTVAGPSSHGQNGNTSPNKSLTKQLPSIRPSIPKSFSSSNLGMTRSGSEPSLLSGLKSMLSRPLAWLASPSRNQQAQQDRSQGKKRDSGWDEEEPGTPTEDDRDMKRLRRRSPSPTMGEYAPKPLQVTGRAVTGFMLPPLPPDVSLRPKSKQGSGSAIPPNFSRPLKSSQSMPYLDPPTSLLSPAKKRSALTRSRRVDMTGTENEEMLQEGEKKEQWSPWKESHSGRTRASLTPARYTPARNGESTDFGLQSGSPFRAPPSPLAPRQTSGMSRSATTSRLRRESTAGSDVNMDRESRGGSRAMIMNGEEDDRMSASGSKRESSVLDWYMKDRWQGGGSPSARAASSRLGSVGPAGSSSGMPPIRKGQFVWDSEKGFVREHELKAETPQNVHQNDAERILFALESMRKTPLAEARTSTSSFSSMPPDLVGSSSRSIRKAISVPLATSQAGDSARSKREKERLGEDYNVMISPYGRRKAVERDQREQRAERSRSGMDEEYRPSHSPSRSVGSRSEASSRGTSDMRSERSEASVTPSPAQTPRRSARNKRKDDAPEEPTPKAQKGRSKKAAPEPSGETPRRRTTRRGTAEKGNSPPPQPANEPAPIVPTIMETAPSPKQSTSSSTYQVREDSGPREKSSLRAKSDITKRKHESAANSRAVSPNGGRYSAREEDLPPMEELETSKIQLPSFSGISFAGLTPNPAPAASSSAAPAASSSSNAQPAASNLTVPSGRPGPLSRFNSSRPRASSPLAGGSIVAEPESPPETGAPAPPVAKPDASGFFALGSSSSTPTNPPPLFTNIANDMRTDAAKKTGTLGIGKPSAPPAANGVPNFFGKAAAPAAAPPPAPASTPFSFGLPKADDAAKPAAPAFGFAKPAESGAGTGASVFGGTPVVIPAAKKSVTEVPPILNGTGSFFGEPAKKPAAEAVAPKAPDFSFATKSAEPAKSTFNFTPAATPALDTAGASKSPFTFGQPATADKPAAAPAPTSSFNFNTVPAATPSLNSGSGGFSFGQPTAKAAEPAAKPAAGMFAGQPPAADASKSPPPPSSANPFGGFFGKPAEPASSAPATPAAAPAANPFAFGAPQPSTSFAFGSDASKPSGAPAGNGFGSAPPSPAAQPAFTFGSSTPTAAPAAAAPAPASPFNFGAPAAAPANGFGAAAPATAPASTGFGGGFGSGFGSGSNAAPARSAQAPASTGFGFGSSTPTQSGFGSGFGTPAAAPPTTPGGSSSFGTGFGFNQPSTTPAGTPSTFNFSANTSTPATPATAPAGSSFSFGSAAAPSPAQPFQFNGTPGGAQTAPNTPGGAPAGGFGFGAGAPANGVPRFGSPQPGAPADGGFSLGMAGDANAPGSPGRRQIKPLRRKK